MGRSLPRISDAESEPGIAGLVTVRACGTLQRRGTSSDPPIHHHKWLCVGDDYTGFDVEESKRRSAAWLALPDVDKSRIGRRGYWQTQVVPRLDDCSRAPDSVTIG